MDSLLLALVIDWDAVPDSLHHFRPNSTAKQAAGPVVAPPRLTCFPNPAADRLSLVGTDLPPEATAADIYNAAGVHVHRWALPTHEGHLVAETDLHHLPNGLYLLRLNGPAGLPTLTFVIRRN